MCCACDSTLVAAGSDCEYVSVSSGGARSMSYPPGLAIDFGTAPVLNFNLVEGAWAGIDRISAIYLRCGHLIVISCFGEACQFQVNI